MPGTLQCVSPSRGRACLNVWRTRHSWQPGSDQVRGARATNSRHQGESTGTPSVHICSESPCSCHSRQPILGGRASITPGSACSSNLLAQLHSTASQQLPQPCHSLPRGCAASAHTRPATGAHAGHQRGRAAGHLAPAEPGDQPPGAAPGHGPAVVGENLALTPGGNVGQGPCPDSGARHTLQAQSPQSPEPGPRTTPAAALHPSSPVAPSSVADGADPGPIGFRPVASE